MDKFLSMPLPQKLLAFVVLLAMVGGGIYYAGVEPAYSQTNYEIRRYRRYMAKYYHLKQFDSAAFKGRILKEQKALQNKRASYERLLPTQAELPEFIESLKSDADTAGLELIKFRKMKKNIPGPSYIKIPIEITVKGSYSQFISFLDTLSSPTKRLVNIEDFRISTAMPSLAKVEKNIGDVGLLRVLRERESVRDLTPSEEQAKQLILFEEAAKRTVLTVNMKAFVFMYTGKK